MNGTMTSLAITADPRVPIIWDLGATPAELHALLAAEQHAGTLEGAQQ